MSAATPEHLARSINFRDLGGVAAADGRRVRRGALFRSAGLGDLTPAERATLAALGLHAIVDLRNNRERAAQPTPWSDLGCRNYWARDHDTGGGGDLKDLLLNRELTRESARDMMLGVYETLPFRHLEAMQSLFQTVIRAEGPILFHCTAGKDRTGLSSALILSAIGVAREAIEADYLATRNFDILATVAFRALPPERREMLAPVYGVEPEYLDTMFAAIEARHGSVQHYLSDALGVTPDDLTRLREVLLV